MKARRWSEWQPITFFFSAVTVSNSNGTQTAQKPVCAVLMKITGAIRTEPQPSRIERIWAESRKKIRVRLDCRNKRRRQNAALRESPPTANADGVRVFGTFPIRGCCAAKIEAVGLQNRHRSRMFRCYKEKLRHQNGVAPIVTP